MTNVVTLPGTANPQDETTASDVSVGPPAEQVFTSIQVRSATEKSIYALFFQQHGKDYSIDDKSDLFLGVFGLPDPRTYERDALGTLPKWYICKRAPEVNLVMMELNFINEFEKGVIIQFVWREGKQDEEVKQFVENVVIQLKQIADVHILESESASKSTAILMPLSLDEAKKILQNIPEMKRIFKDYNLKTALTILNRIGHAWLICNYDQQGRWGPGKIAEDIKISPATVSRYLRAFYLAGLKEIIIEGEIIEIPHKFK